MSTHLHTLIIVDCEISDKNSDLYIRKWLRKGKIRNSLQTAYALFKVSLKNFYKPTKSRRKKRRRRKKEKQEEKKKKKKNKKTA